MAIIAKTVAGLDAAVKRAQKQANKTGRAVEVHYYRPKTEGAGRGRFKAYHSTVYPDKSNTPKLGQWIKAARVRLVKKNGRKVLEVQQHATDAAKRQRGGNSKSRPTERS